MIQNLKELVKYSGFAIPAYAQDIVLKPSGFGASLQSLTIPGMISGAISLIMIVVAAFAIMRLIGAVFGIDLLGNLTIPTFQ